MTHGATEMPPTTYDRNLRKACTHLVVAGRCLPESVSFGCQTVRALNAKIAYISDR